MRTGGIYMETCVQIHSSHIKEPWTAGQGSNAGAVRVQAGGWLRLTSSPLAPDSARDPVSKDSEESDRAGHLDVFA